MIVRLTCPVFMIIKICGITNADDAFHAASLGANALGFIFSKNSPRYVSPQTVEEITPFLPPFIQLVGVFVDAEKAEIEETMQRCRLDVVQLHGQETPEFCLRMNRRVIKAFRVAEPEDVEALAQYQGMISAALLDTKVKNMEGGSGKIFDWGLALKAKEYDIPIILAGGINSGNIKKAIQLVNPYAIDLSSGVESSPGRKDYNKMRDIIQLARDL